MHYIVEYMNLQEAVIEREKMLKCSQKFNANFIGCGTEFMERLHKHLQYFIIKQQSHDPAWQKVEVILSGHLVSISLKIKLVVIIIGYNYYSG